MAYNADQLVAFYPLFISVITTTTVTLHS